MGSSRGLMEVSGAISISEYCGGLSFLKYPHSSRYFFAMFFMFASLLLL